VLFAKGHINGEKNGNLFGMKLNIVLKNVEEISKNKEWLKKRFQLYGLKKI
tara:strand:+ start:250 stop:402 length:153 start_codon:yes stop_codon:yes gene_type:complete